MGKTSKWIKNLLIGKKSKDKRGNNISNEDCSFSTEIPTTPAAVPPNTPKEKKRWSFRRSANASKDVSYMDLIANAPRSAVGSQNQQHSLAVMAAPTVAASNSRRSSALQDAAAIMIQSVFRSYLARKALCALKGLVKLQALVRGHLVRKQAVTTLRCMQALVNVQVRTRAQRIQMAGEAQLHPQRSSPHENSFRQAYNMNRHIESNIKVVEMDLGESKGSTRSRNSNSTYNHVERPDQRYSPHLKQDFHYPMSPAPSVLTDISPKDCSQHFEEYSLSTEQSSPHCYSTVLKQDPIKGPCSSPQPYVDSMSNDHTFFPNYMANTESFKAKARSQSAPKQRLDFFQRQSSKKKASMEGRNVPRAVKMQRSSSHVGQGRQFPWSLKLDRSSISLKESESGSTSTVLTNTNYCRSLAAYEVTNY